MSVYRRNGLSPSRVFDDGDDDKSESQNRHKKTYVIPRAIIITTTATTKKTTTPRGIISRSQFIHYETIMMIKKKKNYRIGSR